MDEKRDVQGVAVKDFANGIYPCCLCELGPELGINMSVLWGMST